MLDAIGAGLAPRIGDRDWNEIWLESPEYKVMRDEIEQIKADGLALPPPEKRKETTCEWTYKFKLVSLCTELSPFQMPHLSWSS